MPSEIAAGYRAGNADAYGMTPEKCISDGDGNPCRHCLRDIPAGAPMLILAYRPFESLGPYSETGPIFLCAEACSREGDLHTMPPVVASRPRFLMRAYDAEERIVYGTGSMVETADIERIASGLLAREGTRFLHLRSAGYNCYQVRIELEQSA
jgi:hypothetical protein